MTRKHIQMPPLPPLLPIALTSLPSVTPAGVANLATLSMMALPSKCSNFAPCQALSSAALVAPSLGNPSARNRLLARRAKLKSSPPMPAPSSSFTSNTAPSTSASRMHATPSQFTTTTKQRLTGPPPVPAHENCMREAHHAKIVRITHIPGVITASDLFTKELKDAAHFRCCRDSTMVSRSNFLTHQHCVPEHMSSRLNLSYYSICSGQNPANFAQFCVSLRLSYRQSLGEGGAGVLRPSVWLPCYSSSLGACRTPII
jgi:hypothetical protein